MQNIIFERFELLLSQQIEAAIAAGVYEMGVETLRAEKFTIEGQEPVYTHPGTGSITNYLKVERLQKNNIKTADEMIELVSMHQACGGTKWSRMLVLQRVQQFVVKEKEHSFAISSV
ncbi:MAG: hypothetical protein V7L26_32570 [Nostoc sp.]|uniref:hypothetical protein n=1 Tax=Nostoc sp. TaxID=1180 RepID=UPI002FF722E5